MVLNLGGVRAGHEKGRKTQHAREIKVNLLAFAVKPDLTFLTLNLGKSLSLPACFIPEAVAVVLPILPVLLLRRRLNLGGPSIGSNFGGFASVLAMVALLLMI